MYDLLNSINLNSSHSKSTAKNILVDKLFKITIFSYSHYFIANAKKSVVQKKILFKHEITVGGV